MEPVDPLEVIISASSYETEAKGGHAVPAWSQNAQLVLKGRKKKEKKGRENKGFGFTFD